MTPGSLSITENWDGVKRLFKQSFKSSFHYSVATVDNKGDPHITPIGSLMLTDPGHAIYFEEFTIQLPANLLLNNKLCILAVNSSKWYWIKSLIGGHFSSPPAVRLYGEAGECRQASEKEISRWQHRVKTMKFTRGHASMWSGMKTVRDIKITKIEPVAMGEMTHNSWNSVTE